MGKDLFETSSQNFFFFRGKHTSKPTEQLQLDEFPNVEGRPVFRLSCGTLETSNRHKTRQSKSFVLAYGTEYQVVSTQYMLLFSLATHKAQFVYWALHLISVQAP